MFKYAAAFGLLAAMSCGGVLAQSHYVEGYLGYFENELRDRAVREDSDSAAVGINARLFVEDNWFVRGSVQYAPTRGKVGDVRFDQDVLIYRAGIGIENAIGDGGATAALRLDYVGLSLRNESEGDKDSSSENGVGLALRIDRRTDRRLFLPYAELGFLRLDDTDGYEVLVGVRYPLLTSLHPYLEYRHNEYEERSTKLSQRSVNVGVRSNFGGRR